MKLIKEPKRSRLKRELLFQSQLLLDYFAAMILVEKSF